MKRGNEVEQLAQIVTGTATSKRHELISVKSSNGYFTLSAFVLGREVSSSVVALEECRVNLLEGFYLNILFSHQPTLLPKFYAWVGIELALALATKGLS